MAKKKIPANANAKKDTRSMEKEKTAEAHYQADKDIEQDPDLASKTSPEDEMDEGEVARLEGED